MQEKQGQSGVEQGPSLAGASSQPLSQHAFEIATCISLAVVEVKPLWVRRVTASKMLAIMRIGAIFTAPLYVFYLITVKLKQQATVYPLASGVAVQFYYEVVDVYVVHRGTMLQLLELGYLTVVTVKAIALKNGECLGVASQYLCDGHFFRDHVDTPRRLNCG